MSDKNNMVTPNKLTKAVNNKNAVETYAFPASYGQKQLFFLNQMDKESSVYNIPFAFRLTGNLDIEALEKSVNEIIDRHETFRTIFTFNDGTLTQVISSKSFLELEIFDFTNEAKQEMMIKEKISEFTLNPFDLEKGPLIRSGLIELNSNENILLLSFHHTILDHTAVLLFFNELTTIYNSIIEKAEPELPLPKIQYADTVIWQHDEQQVAAFRPKLQYWIDQLKDQTSYLEFPIDKKRPARQTFNGVEKQVSLTKELSDKLRDFSRQEKKSLFTVLLAAFKILLYRYTGKTDITVGCPFANRTQPALEEVMGCCMNTLPLRTQFSDENSFIGVLERVKETTLGAQANQEISFEQIIEELHPARDAAYNPLFQISFMFQEPLTTIQLKNISCEAISIKNPTSRFDFTFWMWDDPTGFKNLIQFNTDLFEEKSIDRIFRNYSKLLEELVQNPNKEINKLDLIDEEEKQYLLSELNDTAFDYSKELCIHELIEAISRRFPENIAVIFEGQNITYKELDRRGNQLANQLLKMGIESESLVGIFLDRSIDMVVSMLGILKAGAAYVPLDPSFPKERLTFMLTDAQIKILITQDKYAGTFSDFLCEEICIDKDLSKIDLMPDTKPAKTIKSNSLAYVIYTSGSTGKPKGVLVEHKSFVNFIFSMQKEPGLNSSDIFLSVTTLSFDIAGLEIFLPLITGAQLLIVSKEITINGKTLLDKIDAYKVTVMQATPATYRLMLAAGWNKNKDLKLLCGGETLPYDLAKELFNNSSELWNMYGPTETTVWSTTKKITDPKIVNIGKPINNTEIYILDSNLYPVPFGAIGDLYIGGEGLARGYLNRPDLTEELFITNPFKRNSDSKIYKTGDLARYSINGEIECLGRSDHQIKVRGFRIEPGEIETIMSENQFVEEVVVVSNKNDSDISELVAYLTVDQDKFLTNKKVSDEQILEWNKLWDDTYFGDKTEVKDSTFNISGWKSSYTGKPIPENEMQEWVNNTANRILEFKPRNILEIGCGTGLLLFKLAPYCESYTGTDFSSQVINLTAKYVEEKGLKNVNLYNQNADDNKNLISEFYDVIVINSVIQYFPNFEYFLKVIEKALSLVSPGGKIFIGDVRNRSIHDIFAFSVESERADPKITILDLKENINRRISEERELIFNPEFFYLLKNTVNGISNTEVYLKRGNYLNELNKFRYDVILHCKDKNDEQTIDEWIDYSDQKLKLGDIESILKNTDATILAIKNLPNSRVYKDSHLLSLLNKNREGENTYQLFLENSEVDEENIINPEDLYRLGSANNFKTIVTWSAERVKGSIDVVFIKNDTNTLFNFTPANFKSKNLGLYSNNPIIPKIKKELIPILKESLKQNLPEYMVPSKYVILEEFPLTPNGKIDRRSLPEPEYERMSSNKSYLPPENEIEEKLTQIWQQVLRVKNIGIQDNFFDLGGHSLLVIQLFKQISSELKIELSIANIFEYPTISQLAVKISELQKNLIR